MKEEELVSHHSRREITGEDGKEDGQTSEWITMRTIMAPVDDGKEIEVRRERDGEKLASEDLGHHEKEFEKGQQPEKDRGDKEEVLGREVDLSNILCRKMIEARQDEESQKADANQDGGEITAFLGLSAWP